MRSWNSHDHFFSPYPTALGLVLVFALGCPVDDDGRESATEPTNMATSGLSTTAMSTSSGSDTEPSSSSGSMMTTDSITTTTDSTTTTTSSTSTTSSTTTTTTTTMPDPAECGDGVVEDDEACDDGNDVNDDECSNACERPRLVFISKGVFKGDFAPPLAGKEGLELADAHCQDEAEAADLVGTFRAWLSDDQESPSTRFDTSFTGAYKLADDTVVAAQGWTDLTDGTLAHQIDLDLFGNVWNGDAVRTNTQPNGEVLLPGENCESWSSVSSALSAGSGLSSQTQGGWTANRPNLCSTGNRLYCFEDAPTSG